MQVALYWSAPDRPGNTHYFFTDKNKFLEKMEDYRARTDAEDNYRFENGFLVVTKEYAVDYRKYSYAIFWDDETDFWQCYYIDSAEARGGKVYLALTPDYWGSYIADAEMADLFVSRCNRRIKNYCNFDPIGVVSPSSVVAWHPVGGVYSLNKLAVVLLVSMVTYSGNITGQQNSVSQNRLLKFRPKDLFGADTSDYANLPDILANAGTLYKWNGKREIFQTDLDAHVLRAWLVPSEWLDVRSLGTGDAVFTFRSVGRDADVDVRIGDGGGIVSPGLYEYGLSTDLTLPTLIGNRVLFGTRAKQIELPRGSSTTVIYRVYSYVSGLKICLLINGEEIDITDAFEATLSSDENMYTTTQQVVKAINFAAGSTFGAIKGYGKGGAFGALSSLVSTWGGGLETAVDVNASVGRSAQTGGDALTTYYGYIDVPGRTADFVESPPFGFYLIPSNADEAARVDLEGGIFNTYIKDGLQWVANCASLTGNAEDVFVKGSCKVSGIPTNAAQAIESEVTRGLYYEVLE